MPISIRQLAYGTVVVGHYDTANVLISTLHGLPLKYDPLNIIKTLHR